MIKLIGFSKENKSTVLLKFSKIEDAREIVLLLKDYTFKEVGAIRYFIASHFSHKLALIGI